MTEAAKGAHQIAAAAEEAGSAATQAAAATRQQARGAEDLAAAIEEIASLAEDIQRPWLGGTTTRRQAQRQADCRRADAEAGRQARTWSSRASATEALGSAGSRQRDHPGSSAGAHAAAPRSLLGLANCAARSCRW
jgi:methyl-accepting chemotaxis protein